MGKPPTTDQELSLRVAELEQRADATDAELASLDARVTALERLVTTGEPPDGTWGGVAPPVVDHELPVPEPEPQPPTTGRVATILLDGVEHVFTEDGGTNLGDYVDPHGRFVQHCYAARCASLLDFLVMFRPDADGTREEVVFEFGRCHGNPVGSVLGAYTATITRDGETLATVPVPLHYYYSRWRWQSAPRAVITTAADLIARKLVPHYDKTLVPGMRAGVYADDGPMQTNGITEYMPQTGERDDIGICTESQADYLMYEDAQGLGTVRAWLEGSGTFPWHIRDETTLAPLDFLQYPNAYPGWQGNPALASGYQDTLWIDIAHDPALAYVPFLLTGDPYALEEMQFRSAFHYAAEGVKMYCMTQALRAYAWHMRNVARCVVATPDAVPSWLQPKSIWQTYLDRALAFSLENGPDKPPGSWQQRFGDMSDGLNATGSVSAPMEEYLAGVFLHLADLGVPGWDALRDWKLGGVIARTNGTSGYNRSIPIAYNRALAEGGPTAPIHEDWSAVWVWNAAHDADYSSADPTQVHLATNIDLGQVTTTLACLNWAVRQGVAEAAPCAAWLGAEMAGKWRYMRWAIG